MNIIIYGKYASVYAAGQRCLGGSEHQAAAADRRCDSGGPVISCRL